MIHKKRRLDTSVARISLTYLPRDQGAPDALSSLGANGSMLGGGGGVIGRGCRGDWEGGRGWRVWELSPPEHVQPWSHYKCIVTPWYNTGTLF